MPNFNTVIRKERGRVGEERVRGGVLRGADTVHTVFMNVLSSLSYRDRVSNQTEDD